MARSDPRFHASLRRLPRGLLGMIALLVAIESSVAHHHLAFSTKMSLAWSWTEMASRSRLAHTDILVLGDSLAKLGVLPPVIAGKTGRTCFNLSLPSGLASSSYFVLRNSLDSGARPSAIVINLHPSLLTLAARDDTLYWPELLGFGDLLGLAWNARDPSLALRCGLARLFPSIRYRDTFRERILGSLGGKVEDSPVGLMAHVRNWRVNGGAQVTPASDEPLFTDLPGGPGRKVTWTPHATNVHYLERIFELTHARGIQVYWIVPPMTPRWQERLERLGVDDCHTRFLRGMISRYQNVVVIDGRHSGYGPSLFRDATHLHVRGARAFSSALAEVIGKEASVEAPTQPRWVQLPAYQQPVEPDLLEDLSRSRLVLESGKVRRR